MFVMASCLSWMHDLVHYTLIVEYCMPIFFYLFFCKKIKKLYHLDKWLTTSCTERYGGMVPLLTENKKKVARACALAVIHGGDRIARCEARS
jgi:hypothetical protein